MIYDILPFLPEEIIDIIWNYIPLTQKIFVNKNHYTQLHYLVDTLVPSARYNSYVRDIIRNDCRYVFNFLLTRNFTHWLNKYNYKYNNILYPDYINFILNYACKNNASKCSNSINLQLSLSGLKKEWCKNSKIKHNKWSN